MQNVWSLMIMNIECLLFQLTVDGRTGLCGVHVQQHVGEEHSHERARALTRFRRTVGLVVRDRILNLRTATLRLVQVGIYWCS